MKNNELTKEKMEEAIKSAQLDKKCPVIKIKELIDKSLTTKREGRCSQ